MNISKEESILKKAREYAIASHKDTNHLYDNLPYDFHLAMVVDVAIKFSYLIPTEHQHNVIAACWVHDCIEDCRQTYNDVLKATNEEVAEIAYALTNEKGKSRKERANDKYYAGIRNTPFASFVKLCDRIANVKYSLSQGSKMYEKYKLENESFLDLVVTDTHRGLYNPLIACLKEQFTFQLKEQISDSNS